MDPKSFILRVTAGPTYHDQTEVHVNTPTSVTIDTCQLVARIHIRVKDFRGLPSTSPSNPPKYFSHPLHTNDRYSISFTFVPKETLSGNDLIFGNDFDHPIRDRLPPGFGTAFNYVKGWIDPGLYGDPMADEPFLYGPLLSSVNVLRVGGREIGYVDVGAEQEQNYGFQEEFEREVEGEGDVEVEIVEEGADDEDGMRIREELEVPDTSSQRMKFFLSEDKRKEFQFEEGRTYKFDFFNGYLDFNDFALRLPFGLSLNVVRHWDGQPLRTHALRYVLRNRKTDTLLFAVSFNLVPTNEVAHKAANAQASIAIEDVQPLTNLDERVNESNGHYEDEGVD